MTLEAVSCGEALIAELALAVLFDGHAAAAERQICSKWCNTGAYLAAVRALQEYNSKAVLQ